MYRPVHPWRCYTCTKLLNPTTAPSPATSLSHCTSCAFSASSLPSLPVQQQHAGAEWQDSEGSRSRLSGRYLLCTEELSSVLLPSPILASPRRIEDVTCLECLALGRKPSIVALAHTPSRLKERFELEVPSAPLRLLRLPQPDSPNRHLPSSPRIRTCNPFGQWRPEKKPLIVTVSTSVSHAHHLPPKRSNSPPRAPREARQRGLFGDPLLPPWPKLQPLLRLFGNRPTRATEFAQRQKHIELSRQHKALSCLVTLRGESRRLGYYTHPSASALLSPPTYPRSSRRVLALSRWTSMS